MGQGREAVDENGWSGDRKKGMWYSISAGQHQAVRWALLSQRAFHHLFPIKATWKWLAGLKHIGARCLGPVTFATCFPGLS